MHFYLVLLLVGEHIKEILLGQNVISIQDEFYSCPSVQGPLLPPGVGGHIQPCSVCDESPPGISLLFHKKFLDLPYVGIFACQLVPGSVVRLEKIVCLNLILQDGIVVVP